MKASTLDRKFSLERGGHLLGNRIIEDATVLGMGLAVVVALNLLGFIFSRSFFFNHAPALWNALIILSGLLLSGQAFKAMHDGRSGTDWLLLPVSPLEKYLAALVEYIILFPLAAAALATGLSALFQVIELAMGGRGGVIWTPFSLGALKSWGQYAIFGLAFLAGSAHFRKAALLKTLAVAATYALLVSGILAFGAWAVAKGHGMGSYNFSFTNGNFDMGRVDLPESAALAFTWIYRLAWFAILPIFSLGYGYLRVFEKEARDAVQ